jgi:ubiquinone/menaquinone biosynthesis C-methylase UbiE
MPYKLKTEFDLSDPSVVSVIDDLPLWSAPFGLKLLEVVRLRENMRVLDVGTGAGFPSVELAQRLGRTCEVHAVDPWEPALERARQKIRQWNVTNLHLIEGMAESLEFEDDYFDLIVSNNGTNNVDDEEKVCAELGRVARRGAQMVLTMNLPDTMKEFYDTFEEILSGRGMSAEIERLTEHIFEKRKPLDHTRQLLDRSGFAVNDIYEDAFTMRFTDGTAMLSHSVIRLGFLGSWVDVLSPPDVEPVFSSIESALNRRARDRGELRLTIPWACFDCERTG